MQDIAITMVIWNIYFFFIKLRYLQFIFIIIAFLGAAMASMRCVFLHFHFDVFSFDF